MCELDEDLSGRDAQLLHALLSVYVTANLEDGNLPDLKGTLEAIVALKGQAEPFLELFEDDLSGPSEN